MDGNSAVVTAIDEILGVHRTDGIPSEDVSAINGGNALYAAARKAAQSQEASINNAATSDIVARHEDHIALFMPLFKQLESTFGETRNHLPAHAA